MRGTTQAWQHPESVTVYIVRREISPDPATGRPRARWHVRYQARRRSPIVHLGVFESETLAKIRRQAALEEVARGGTPTRVRVAPAPAVLVTVAVAAEEWLGTLQDLAPSTLKGYRKAVRDQPDWLSSLDAHSLTRAHVQTFALDLGARFKRGTAAKELGVLRRALDHAGVEPNPAADRRIRLPRAQRRVYRLPTRAQLAAMHEAMPSRSALMLLLEHTGLRIKEAAALRWRDIDHERARLLVSDSKTAAGRRFVERLPDAPPFPWPPPGTQPEDIVFRSPSPASLTGMIRVAHERHGTFLMSSHELRHLHASRLLHDGVLSPAQIAARLGHASPLVTLGTYAHLVPPSD